MPVGLPPAPAWHHHHNPGHHLVVRHRTSFVVTRSGVRVSIRMPVKVQVNNTVNNTLNNNVGNINVVRPSRPPEEIPPEPQPGVTVESMRLNYVEHEITANHYMRNYPSGNINYEAGGTVEVTYRWFEYGPENNWDAPLRTVYERTVLLQYPPGSTYDSLNQMVRDWAAQNIGRPAHEVIKVPDGTATIVWSDGRSAIVKAEEIRPGEWRVEDPRTGEERVLTSSTR